MERSSVMTVWAVAGESGTLDGDDQIGRTPEARVFGGVVGCNDGRSGNPSFDRAGRPGGGGRSSNETFFFSGVTETGIGGSALDRLSHRDVVFVAGDGVEWVHWQDTSLLAFLFVDVIDESMDMSLRFLGRGRSSASLWAKQQSRPYGHSLSLSTYLQIWVLQSGSRCFGSETCIWCGWAGEKRIDEMLIAELLWLTALLLMMAEL
eukprot:scaffold116120_cov47-Cyclotella_meneghiniana.AAC.1